MIARPIKWPPILVPGTLLECFLKLYLYLHWRSSGRLFPMLYLNFAKIYFCNRLYSFVGKNNHQYLLLNEFSPKALLLGPLLEKYYSFYYGEENFYGALPVSNCFTSLYLQRYSLISYTQSVFLPFVLIVFRTFNTIWILKFNFVFLFKLYVPKSFLKYERRLWQ